MKFWVFRDLLSIYGMNETGLVFDVNLMFRMQILTVCVYTVQRQLMPVLPLNIIILPLNLTRLFPDVG